MPPISACPIDASFFQPRRDTVMAWLGMAGLIVNSRGTVILIDPLIAVTERAGAQWSETGLRMKVPVPIEAREVPRADVVCYTHAEDDHCGRGTARVLNERLQPIFVGPPPVFRRLVGQIFLSALGEVGIDALRQVVARDFERLRFGDVEIEVTPALHDHDATNPWKRGDCVGYVLRTPDGAIWHPGDTRLIPELLEVRGVDVLLWDVSVNVPTHLCPEGSAALAKSCGAKVLVAYHYGTMIAPERGAYARALESDPEDSKPYLAGVAGEFRVMNPGEALTLPV
jgi:L-ascorbate metabolism protein UlaG (beta-lactamase superfamily)